MSKFVLGSRILFTLAILLLVHTIAFNQTQKDIVNGNLIQFNNIGLWCWYQDERAVIDMNTGKLIIGSVAYRGE